MSIAKAQYPSGCSIADTYMILSEEFTPYQTMVIKFDTKADVTSTSCLGNKPSGEGVVVDDLNQRVYIARRDISTFSSAVDVYDVTTGTKVATWNFPAPSSAGTSNPHDMAISADKSTIYLAFTESSVAGQYYGVFRALNANTGAILYEFTYPVNIRIWGITTDASGNIYVTKQNVSTKDISVIKIDPLTYTQTTIYSANGLSLSNPVTGVLGITYVPTSNSLWVYGQYYNISGVMMNISLSGTLLSSCIIPDYGVQPIKYGPDGFIYSGSFSSTTCVGRFDPTTCSYTTYVPQTSANGSAKGLAFACKSQVFCTPVCTIPVAGTPSVTQATCNAAGTATNNDASISISGITNGTVYAYTTDGTTPSFASATTISGGTISLTGLSNPSSALTYKFRIFNGSATCYLDVTATLNPTTCTPTCVPPSPTGTGAAVCAGNTATLTVSGCNATYPAVWYSNAALTTQVGTGNSFTTPVLNTTTPYYVACVKDATCKSSGATVTATVTPLPTAGTPSVTPATCNAAGTAANNDASISIAGITNATVYAYTTDGTTPSFASATTISGGTISLTGLSNPSSPVIYKFRIFNGSATCYLDVTATLNPTTCTPTCTPPSPTGTGASVCAGNTATLTVSGCNATYPAVWYSNAALTTQVGTGNSFTTPVLTTTTTYYVACVKDATCKSSGATVTATVTPLPTAGTPSVTQATCNAAGTATNNDASISISGITNATVYAYTTDGTTPSFASATTISGGTISLTGLSNPSSAVTYKFRIFNGSATCYLDVTATLNPKTCSPTCVNPSGKGYGIPPTCTGTNLNSDGTIQLNSLTNVTKYGYSVGSSYAGANYATATALVGTSASVTGLSISGINMTYTVRLFNGNDACFTDVLINMPFNDCNVTCTINAGSDQLICAPTNTVDLPDATASQEWVVGSLNPSGATINASTGIVSGMSVNGIYSFILRETANTACQDEVNVFRSVFDLPFMSSCESSYQLPTIAGVTWASTSGGASVSASGLITGMNTNGTYTFTANFGSCISNVTVEKITCTCIPPNAGADFTICLPKTNANLADAISGTQWAVVAGNPSTTTIDASTGEITGLSVVGTYKFKLQKTSDITCFDEIQIIVTNGDTPIVLCNDGSTSYTLLAPSNLSNVIWYNMAGTQVGIGNNLVVTSNTTGLSDGTEAYYYKGTDGSGTGCDVELCCPVKFLTQTCCPVPNCVSVTVIKN